MRLHSTQRQQFVQLCRCGCGQPTLLADRNDRVQDYVQGQPLPFLYGHHYRGTESHLYRGGNGYVGKNGYVVIYVDGVQVYEHRHVWEQAYGPIPLGYDIHHKNHERADNRLANLELLPKADHTRLHRQDFGWAKGYSCCVRCGKTDSRHASRGMCNRCYKWLAFVPTKRRNIREP